MSKFQAGLLGAIIIVIATYLAYTKFANPFASKFTVHALFSSANGLRPDSFVRIAGVNVGTVTNVAPVASCKVNGTTEKACQVSDVTMEIQDVGLPLHSDATFAIRPRIFLEGNFFVDVSPGTPGAPAVKSGHTFPISQGTEPVHVVKFLL
ncbi:MAG: MlaD family protein [Solirubrobacteraceae bacterium]